MTDHRVDPFPWSTSPEDASSQSAAQPGGAPTTERAPDRATRPWFRKKRLILAPALLVAIVFLLAVYVWSNTAKVTSPPPAKAVAADIGSKVRDGAFEFVVTAVEHPGKTFEGKVGEKLTAQGEFVIVRVSVTNLGTTAQRLGCTCQYLFNDKGQQFATSPYILSTRDALKFVQWIDPGATVKDASVLFDVAPGTKALHIELHDSPSSPGVKVTLS